MGGPGVPGKRTELEGARAVFWGRVRPPLGDVYRVHARRAQGGLNFLDCGRV